MVKGLFVIFLTPWGKRPDSESKPAQYNHYRLTENNDRFVRGSCYYKNQKIIDYLMIMKIKQQREL